MDAHGELLLEHEKLLKKIDKWRSATVWYRWLNVFVFMTCKLFVPTAALLVAVNMVSIVLDKQLIDSFTSSLIAIAVTFLASVEAMLNPGAKKRLAFTLYNELNSIENKLNIAKISDSNESFRERLIWADEEMKRLLNHYSENGY
ncbi:MAG: hypothetical protein WB764_24310 [Xanthobacteraceae bacterium]